MVVRTILRITQHATFIALVCLLFANAALAQPKNKGNKVRDDKKGGEPEILKNLPEFFSIIRVVIQQWRITVGLCVGGVQNSCRPATEAR